MPVWSFTANRAERRAAERDVHKRRGKSATYTVPLLGDGPRVNAEHPENHHHHNEEEAEDYYNDVQSFLTQWYGRDIFTKTALDSPRLLRQYPDTLGTHYALLVPDVVSFDAFWARYYYRCSVTTILAERQRTRRRTERVSHLAAPTVVPGKWGVSSGHIVLDDATNATRRRAHDTVDKVAARAPWLADECDTDIVETSLDNDDDDDDVDNSQEEIGLNDSSLDTAAIGFAG